MEIQVNGIFERSELNVDFGKMSLSALILYFNVSMLLYLEFSFYIC